MAAYVLVHGAWHGGWCWRDTAKALRAAGHDVFTPTHTGVGQRAHLASQAVVLETHIADIVGCIEAEELGDVILCGHSYGGMVITGVADRMGERIKALSYLDAFLPGNGDSLIGLLSRALAPEVAAQFIGAFRGAALEGHSGLTQPIPAEVFGIRLENRPWVDRRCRPQALATFEVPLLMKGGANPAARHQYILADAWDPSPFRFFYEQCRLAGGWDLVKLPSSHDVMVDMPHELAAHLMRLC